MSTEYTLIEYMPRHLRASHEAARNDGSYPANGAIRDYVVGPVNPSDLHPRWARVIADGLDSIPDDEPAYDEIPEDALAPYIDPEEEAGLRADYRIDQAKDDRLMGRE